MNYKTNKKNSEVNQKRNIKSKIGTLKATQLSVLLDNCKEHEICFLNSTIFANPKPRKIKKETRNQNKTQKQKPNKKAKKLNFEEKSENL